MINQIRAESFKLRRNRTFWVLIVASVGLSALLHYLVIIDWWQMHGTTFEDAGLSQLNAMTTIGHPLFFIFFVSTLAGFFIANEFSQSGVIKNQIISGSKRSHIILSKYLLFTIGSIVVTTIIPFMIALLEMILLGHGEILSLSRFLYLGRAFGLFTLQFLGFTAIIMLIAIAMEDSGKTIIISIVFTLFMDLVRLLPKTPFISAFYENSIFHQFSEVFKFSMTNGEIMKSMVIGLLTFAVIILSVIVIFNKKEIK